MDLATALKDAVAALERKDLARAEEICREILKVHPLQAQALDMLAAALVAQGHTAEALAGYRAIVDGLHRGLLATQLPFGLQTLQGLGFRPKGILDIGAYEGTFAIMAKHFFPQAPVLMFEAQPGKEQILKTVAAGLADVDYRMGLLGPENRAQVPFGVVNPTGNTSGSSLYEEQTRFARDVIFLPMRTLDDVVAEFAGREFDMLKLDVQGAELDVLRGAARTLAGIEVIVIELSLQEYNKGAPLIAEVVARLDALGFALFDMFGVSRMPTGILLQSDGVFLRRDSRFWPKGPFL